MATFMIGLGAIIGFSIVALPQPNIGLACAVARHDIYSWLLWAIAQFRLRHAQWPQLIGSPRLGRGNLAAMS